MLVERRELVTTCYSQLRKICLDMLNMDFRLVDMRWAECDEVTSEHVLEGLCQDELAACRRLSFGPYFMVSTSPF